MFQLPRLRLAVFAMLAVVAFAALPAAATAAKPERFVIQVDETFTFFSESCGFEITQTVTGTIKGVSFFDEEGNLVREIVQVNINGSFAANGNVVPFITRATDRVTIHPDGSLTIHTTGIIGRAVVRGEGLVGATIGHFLLTISPEGEETFEMIGGQENEEEFFGTPGNPGTLCDLLAA